MRAEGEGFEFVRGGRGRRERGEYGFEFVRGGEGIGLALS